MLNGFVPVELFSKVVLESGGHFESVKSAPLCIIHLFRLWYLPDDVNELDCTGIYIVRKTNVSSRLYFFYQSNELQYSI